jgi:DNA-binding PucR family transcriptional regulator
LAALHRGTAIGRTGDVVHAVVPLTSGEGAGRPDGGVRAAVERFLDQSTSARAAQLLVALPAVVCPAGALPRAREQAERILAVLRRSGRTGIADVEEVGAAALIDVLAEALDRDPDLGADGLRRVTEYDAAKGTQFAETLAAWLDAFGETEIAAAQLYVHPNTVRYRIRQLRELELVALDDPVERLALLVHLHRARLRTPDD